MSSIDLEVQRLHALRTTTSRVQRAIPWPPQKVRFVAKAAIPLDAGYAWRDDARHRGLKVKWPQRRHADSSTSGIIGGAGSGEMNVRKLLRSRNFRTWDSLCMVC